MGFTTHPNGLVQKNLGEGPPDFFHVFRTSLADTMEWALQSWVQLHTVRLQSSRDEWRQLSPHWGTWSIAPTNALASRPLSRVYRTAAIMTPTAKLHTGFDDPDKCPLCGGCDSIKHLLLECPELADLRTTLDVPALARPHVGDLVCRRLGATLFMGTHGLGPIARPGTLHRQS